MRTSIGSIAVISAALFSAFFCGSCDGPESGGDVGARDASILDSGDAHPDAQFDGGDQKDAAGIPDVKIAWKTEMVDEKNPPVLSNTRQVVYDGEGRAHLFYGGWKLVHRYLDGSKWVSEVLDETDYPWGTEVAATADSKGNLHVVYAVIEQKNGRIKYATNASGQWQFETVSLMTFDYSSLAIAVGPDGAVYVLASYNNQNLILHQHKSPKWSSESVEVATNMVYGPSVAVDANNVLHMLYYAENDAKHVVTHAKRAAGGALVKEIILDYANATGYPGSTSMSPDSKGKVHALYFDPTDGYNEYVVLDGSGTGVAPRQALGSFSEGGYGSIAVDPDDKVHIAQLWITDTSVTFEYRTNKSGGWTYEDIATFDTGPDISPGDTPISVSATKDKAAILYMFRPFHPWNALLAGTIYFAENPSGTMKSEAIDSSGTTGVCPDLKLDSSGQFHIVYTDVGGEKLMHAKGNVGNWTTEEVVDIRERHDNDNLLYVANTPLAIDRDGKLHVAYIIKGLRYCDNVSGAWQCSPVDESQLMGGNSGIGYDRDGLLHLVTAGNFYMGLTHYYKQGAGWVPEVLDERYDFEGDSNSLVIDGDGVFHLAFVADWHRVFYARGKTGNWQIDQIEGGDDFYKYIGGAVGADGAEHVVYARGTQTKRPLIYAARKGGDWATAVIDPDVGGWSEYMMDGGGGTSMAVDRNGAAHVCYYNAISKSLYYATNKYGPWIKGMVDGGGAVDTGWYCSIVADDEGFCHIAYYSDTQRSLKYATNRQN